MKRPLVIGGASGIGLSLVMALYQRSDVERVYVVDRQMYPAEYADLKIQGRILDLSAGDFSFLDELNDVDALFITAGFGHLGMVQDFDDAYIERIMTVNATAPIRIIRHFYDKLLASESFPCAVMVSIAGRLSSPLFAYYSASKAAVRMFAEAANVELEVQESPNRILEVSPGSLKGTSFNGGASDPSVTASLAQEIIARAEAHQTLFISQYDEVFRGVIERYHTDPHKYGVESYWYKKNGRQHKK